MYFHKYVQVKLTCFMGQSKNCMLFFPLPIQRTTSVKKCCWTGLLNAEGKLKTFVTILFLRVCLYEKLVSSVSHGSSENSPLHAGRSTSQGLVCMPDGGEKETVVWVGLTSMTRKIYIDVWDTEFCWLNAFNSLSSRTRFPLPTLHAHQLVPH